MNYEDLKIPPSSIADEQSVLGGVLMAGLAGESMKAWGIVSEIISESDFYRQDHRLIFRAYESLVDEGKPLDLTTVSTWLGGNGELENAGGFAYLATMAKDTPSAANIKAYAQNVKRLSITRQFIGKLSGLVDMAYSAGSSEDAVSMLLEQAGRDVSMLEMSQDGGDKSVTMKQASREAVALIEIYAAKRGGVIGIDTGIDALNDEIGGWHDTDLIVIPARSGMGKTALAMTFAKAAAKSGRKVGVISTEMANKQLALRHISSNSGVSMVDIRRGNLTDADWAQLGNAIKTDVESNVSSRIKLNDSAIDLLSIQRQARAWKREFGMELLIVDYLQNVSVTGRKGITGDKTAEVMEVSRQLKQMAKQLGIPVIALAQVRRDVDDRGDKRPNKSDVSWAAQIEQDADVMISLYRHSVYNKDFGQGGYDEVQNIAELEILKNRHGNVGRHYSVFRPRRVDFVSADPNGVMAYLDAIGRKAEEGAKKRNYSREVGL